MSIYLWDTTLARRSPSGAGALEAAPVVLERVAHDLAGLGGAVHVGDLGVAPLGARHVLVREEIVAEALHEGGGAVAEIAEAAVGRVALQHGEDLVVRLRAVEHPEAADGPGGNDD